MSVVKGRFGAWRVLGSVENMARPDRFDHERGPVSRGMQAPPPSLPVLWQRYLRVPASSRSGPGVKRQAVGDGDDEVFAAVGDPAEVPELPGPACGGHSCGSYPRWTCAPVSSARPFWRQMSTNGPWTGRLRRRNNPGMSSDQTLMPGRFANRAAASTAWVGGQGWLCWPRHDYA